MADQGRWFKLWCSARSDPDLDNLSIDDFGRWTKLGTLIKEQGTDGSLVIPPPARSLCAQLQLVDFEALIACLSRLPHLTIVVSNGVTLAHRHMTVTFNNWHKYQIDSSADRMREKREKAHDGVTPKKRREEKRGEEIRKEEKETTTLPATPTPRAGRGKLAKPPAPRGDHQRLIDHASTTHLTATGNALLIDGGRDGAIVKGLLNTYPYEKLATWWDGWLASEDPFLRRGGFSFPKFRQHLPALMAAASTAKGEVDAQGRAVFRTESGQIIPRLCLECCEPEHPGQPHDPECWAWAIKERASIAAVWAKA